MNWSNHSYDLMRISVLKPSLEKVELWENKSWDGNCTTQIQIQFQNNLKVALLSEIICSSDWKVNQISHLSEKIPTGKVEKYQINRGHCLFYKFFIFFGLKRISIEFWIFWRIQRILENSKKSALRKQTTSIIIYQYVVL